MDGDGASSPTSTDSSEAVPHARGPPVVGVEDVGLQNGRGVEMSLSTEEASNGVRPPQTVAVGEGDGDSDTVLSEGQKDDPAAPKTTGPNGCSTSDDMAESRG